MLSRSSEQEEGGFTKALKRFPFRSHKHEQVLKGWRSFAGANDMWRKIEAAAARHGRAKPDATNFINYVLSAMWPSTRMVEHEKLVKASFKKLKREIVQQVKLTDSPYELDDVLSFYMDKNSVLSRSLYDFNSSAFGRKNENGSRDRSAFYRRVGSYLMRICGEWRDEDLALLADMIFRRGRNRATTVDQVSAWRRPSTTAARARKEK